MNCKCCKTKSYHIMRVLFVRGLTTSLMVCGLGVEDHQKGLWTYCTFVIFFLCVGIGPNSCSTAQNQGPFMNWNDKQILLSLFSWVRENLPSRYLADCRSVYLKSWGHWWTLALNRGVWIIKICKNFDHEAFHLGTQPYDTLCVATETVYPLFHDFSQSLPVTPSLPLQLRPIVFIPQPSQYNSTLMPPAEFVVPVHTMTANGGTEEQLREFFSSLLDLDE
jgi:hypothetical protein